MNFEQGYVNKGIKREREKGWAQKVGEKFYEKG